MLAHDVLSPPTFVPLDSPLPCLRSSLRSIVESSSKVKLTAVDAARVPATQFPFAVHPTDPLVLRTLLESPPLSHLPRAAASCSATASTEPAPRHSAGAAKREQSPPRSSIPGSASAYPPRFIQVSIIAHAKKPAKPGEERKVRPLVLRHLDVGSSHRSSLRCLLHRTISSPPSTTAGELTEGSGAPMNASSSLSRSSDVLGTLVARGSRPPRPPATPPRPPRTGPSPPPRPPRGALA